jgi:pilus assembly protein CpaF
MAVNPNSHIIAVAGGKGGVGKSVFSANLALSFLLEHRAPTLLVDLDSQSCGDQNVILGIREPKTMSDLCNYNGTLSPFGREMKR